MKTDLRREDVRTRAVRARASEATPRSEHAVLALQRAAGNQATARLLQRKIGFEFEMDTLFSAFATPVTDKEKQAFASQVLAIGEGKPIAKDFTPHDQVQPRDYLGTGRLVDSKARPREGAADPNGPPRLAESPPEFLGDANDPYRLHALSKKDVIVRRPGYTLEADEGNADVDGVAYSNTEFVTDPFDETAQGRKELVKSLENLIVVTDEISRLAGKGRKIVHAAEVAPGGGQVGKVLIATPLLGGALQVTGGIDLARVGTLMQGMQADTDESKESKGERQMERHMLGAALGPDPGIIGSAPRRADEAIRFVLSLWEGEEPPEHFGSPELKSFVSLVASYLTMAAGPAIGYAKTIAPLMARTDFARMYTLIPEHEYLTSYPELLRMIVGRTAELDMNGLLFPSGIYRDARSKGKGNPDALAGLTRRRWLLGMAIGVDYLTAATFNLNPDLNAADPLAPKKDLESMGARGSTTEGVGWFGNTQAPIFELRALGQIHNPRAFSERALALFDYLAAINYR